MCVAIAGRDAITRCAEAEGAAVRAAVASDNCASLGGLLSLGQECVNLHRALCVPAGVVFNARDGGGEYPPL